MSIEAGRRKWLCTASNRKQMVFKECKTRQRRVREVEKTERESGRNEALERES
jgi:hypothetical protein